MRQLVFILAISFSLTFLQAQNQTFVFQDFKRIYYQVDPDSIIDNLQNLPSNIQDILTDFLSQRFGVYSNDLLFHSGYLYDLESIERTRPDVLSSNRKSLFVIPQYDLKYIFKNEEIGIRQYWVNIKLDKYGQVSECNFPSIVRRDFRIIPFERVKVITDSLLLETEEYLKVAPIKIDLIYEKHEEILTWQLCYFKSSGQDYKDYLCFILNAHDGLLIRKEGMMETWIIDCCPNPGGEPVHFELKSK